MPSSVSAESEVADILRTLYKDDRLDEGRVQRTIVAINTFQRSNSTINSPLSPSMSNASLLSQNSQSCSDFSPAAIPSVPPQQRRRMSVVGTATVGIVPAFKIPSDKRLSLIGGPAIRAPFPLYSHNRDSISNVPKKHTEAVLKYQSDSTDGAGHPDPPSTLVQQPTATPTGVAAKPAPLTAYTPLLTAVSSALQVQGSTFRQSIVDPHFSASFSGELQRHKENRAREAYEEDDEDNVSTAGDADDNVNAEGEINGVKDSMIGIKTEDSLTLYSHKTGSSDKLERPRQSLCISEDGTLRKISSAREKTNMTKAPSSNTLTRQQSNRSDKEYRKSIRQSIRKSKRLERKSNNLVSPYLVNKAVKIEPIDPRKDKEHSMAYVIDLHLKNMSSLEYRNYLRSRQMEVNADKVINANAFLDDLAQDMNAIVTSYVHSTAEYQVNVPASIQQEIITQSGELSLSVLALQQRQIDTLEVRFTELEVIVHRITKLFSKASYEVYNLLKNDGFVRYKVTDGFEEFIRKMKPFNHRKSSVSSKLKIGKA